MEDPKPENNRELRAYVRALDCEWVVHVDLVNQREPVTGGRVVSRGPDRDRHTRSGFAINSERH